MRKLERLKKEARETASFRGHKLTTFRPISVREITFSAVCKVCSMEVQVITDPLPNEIEIGGPAVALNCHKQESEEK